MTEETVVEETVEETVVFVSAAYNKEGSSATKAVITKSLRAFINSP